MVSVRLTSYNHKELISRAIESVFNQIVDFSVEIVVGDDFSTDGTAEILKQYEDTGNVHVKILNRTNDEVYIKQRNEKGRLYNFYDTLKNCTGKYIAFLDGDDYWTDPYKLQKQVDFLEKHPQYSMCFTNFNHVDEFGNEVLEDGWHNKLKGDLSHFEILSRYAPKIVTNLVRRDLIPSEFPEEFFQVHGGDYFLFSLLSKHGPAAYIDEVMASYRVHSGGVWSLKSDEEKYNRQMHTYKVSWTYFTEKEEREAIRVAISRPFKNLFWIYTQKGKVSFLKKNLNLFFVALKYGLLKEWWRLNKKLLKK